MVCMNIEKKKEKYGTCGERTKDNLVDTREPSVPKREAREIETNGLNHGVKYTPTPRYICT